MAKTTKKRAPARAAKPVEPMEIVTVPEVPATTSTLSPREQAKALLAQKTLAAKWQALYAKAKNIPVAPYNMKNRYEKQTAINHKTLGWGFITEIRNDRLEVLFQDGIKYLISNYK